MGAEIPERVGGERTDGEVFTHVLAQDFARVGGVEHRHCLNLLFGDTQV
jgi:hypothetical protein